MYSMSITHIHYILFYLSAYLSSGGPMVHRSSISSERADRLEKLLHAAACPAFSQGNCRRAGRSFTCAAPRSPGPLWVAGYTAQCALWVVCFPSNPTSWDISWNLCLDTSFNINLSQLVPLEGKLDFQGNRDFQTLNLGFPGHFDRFWVFQK